MSANASLSNASDESLRDTANLTRWVLNIYLSPPVCLFGTVGNIISILVLARDRTCRHTTRFLLQMLAIADALYLVFQISTVIMDEMRLQERFANLVYVLPFAWPLTEVVHNAGIWTVVIVTVDRYIAICKPLHAPVYSTLSRARKATFAVWLFALVYCLPQFFEMFVSERWNADTNTTTLHPNRTAFAHNRTYFIVYRTGVFFALQFVAPLTCLSYINVQLVGAIRLSLRVKQGSGQTKPPSHASHTRILVVVVIVFILCMTPALLVRVVLSYCYFTGFAASACNLYMLNIWIHFINFLRLFNSAVNFLIYFVFGSRFRRHVKELMCDRDRRAQDARERSLSYQSTLD